MKPTDPDYNERMAELEMRAAKQLLLAIPFALILTALFMWLT